MTDEADREGWTGRGRWWIASGVFVVAVLLGLLAIFVLPNQGSDAGQPAGPGQGGPTTAGPPSVPPAASSSASDAAEEERPEGWDDPGCNGEPGSEELPTAAPDTSWDPVGGSNVPQSDDYGPSKINGPLRQCYHHSPIGAVFAAASITTLLGAHPEAATDIIKAGIAAGPGKTAMLEAAANGSSGSYTQSAVAFRVEGCAPGRCNVDLIFEVNGGQLAQTPFSLVWESGDWRVDAAAAEAGGVQPVEQVPAGFVSWGR